MKNTLKNKLSKNSIKIIIDTSSSSLINVTPKKFSDSKLVSKELLKGNAMVVDVSEMPSAEAVRFIDFITGVLFTTQGGFKKIGHKTYLLAPSKEILSKFMTQFREIR